MFLKRRTLCFIAAMLVATSTFAQEPSSQPTPEPIHDNVPRVIMPAPAEPFLDLDQSPPCVEIGTFEEIPTVPWFAEMMVGRYRSEAIGPRIPRFEYVPVAFRLGCGPKEEGGFFARHVSFLAEVTVDPITETFGNIATGPSVMVRFDACPQQRICPYFQAGTGFVFTDAYRDKDQRAIGEEFEFLQQLEVGVRWKLTDSLAIQSEFGLQHISNAGLAGRNLGANSLGFSVGFQWTFGAGRDRPW
jgi:lipid A 3-O-deacylase